MTDIIKLAREAGAVTLPSGEAVFHSALSLGRFAELVAKQAQNLEMLRMIATRARNFPNYPLGYHIPEVFAAVGEQPPEPQAQEPVNVWQRAVDDELVSAHLGIANNDATYAQAKLKLHELICWSIQVDKDLSAPKQAEPEA